MARKSKKNAPVAIDMIESAVEPSSETILTAAEIADVHATVAPELQQPLIDDTALDTLMDEADLTPEEVLAMDAVAEENEDVALEEALAALSFEPEAPVQIAEAPVDAPQADATDPVTIERLANEQDPERVERMIQRTNAELDERKAFEVAKNPSNDNIHRTIKKCRGSLARQHAAKLMLAANVDPAFMNRSLHDGSAYNVYAILKFADFVDGLVGAGMHNAINIACMRSLFNFRKAGIVFNGEMAKAAASDKIRVADNLKKHLIRHTVSASTAPTQASSTMQALETLGVVRVVGSRKHPTYEIVDSPVTRKLEALAEAMAA